MSQCQSKIYNSGEMKVKPSGKPKVVIFGSVIVYMLQQPLFFYESVN